MSAYFLFFFKEKVNVIFSSPWLYLINILVLCYFLFVEIWPAYRPLVLGLMFSTLILFVIQNNFRFNLRNKVLDEIGKISYGVYMYHPMVMFISFAIINNGLNITNKGIGYNVLVYMSVITITLLISYISFQYFESRFIRIKNRRFTLINSGEETSSEGEAELKT
jgi:peptidoglycan/LPS O-acetylase OafA/YrhL